MGDEGVGVKKKAVENEGGVRTWGVREKQWRMGVKTWGVREKQWRMGVRTWGVREKQWRMGEE